VKVFFDRFKSAKPIIVFDCILKIVGGKDHLRKCYNDDGWGGCMPQKIRQLKSSLRKAGFYCRPGKGSHTVWKHTLLPGTEITISGRDGDDAQPYQTRDVRKALEDLERKQHGH
jgi:predicted RNA binding protein YcfA (HicA-like mRNA interferase family)